MTDLTLLGIAEAGRLMARGDISASELTNAFLKRIDAVDRKIASYITVTSDLAHNAARQADMEMKGGVRRGPMHGIPIALKDIYETAGVPTTGHSHLKKDYVPAIDAETVRRLKDAGAIILGKVGTHEFANGAMTPDQPFPPVLNPWNTRYQPGGSSSGSGAALAAGLDQLRDLAFAGDLGAELGDRRKSRREAADPARRHRVAERLAEIAHHQHAVGEHVGKTRRLGEIDIETVDQDDVADGKLGQHGPRLQDDSPIIKDAKGRDKSRPRHNGDTFGL